MNTSNAMMRPWGRQNSWNDNRTTLLPFEDVSDRNFACMMMRGNNIHHGNNGPAAAAAASSSAGSASRVSGSNEQDRTRIKIAHYGKMDILSGRGGLANKHTGNRVFRRLIKQNKDQYKGLKSKRKQNLLIESILLALDSQGSRFLKEDKNSGAWYEISYKDAWAKTSQALREPDKKSGDDSSTTCSPSVTSGMVGSSSTMSSGPIPTKFITCRNSDINVVSANNCVRPVSLRRQYTTDNPPCADRRIFDDDDDEVAAPAPTPVPPLPVSPDDDDDDDDVNILQQVAPVLLSMTTSTFSAIGASMQMAPQPTPQPPMVSSWTHDYPSASHPSYGGQQQQHQQQQQQQRQYCPPPVSSQNMSRMSSSTFMDNLSDLLRSDSGASYDAAFAPV